MKLKKGPVYVKAFNLHTEALLLIFYATANVSKFNGGPFNAFVGCKKDNFKYKGKQLETIFPSSKWANRSFCPQCGSSLMCIYHKKT